MSDTFKKIREGAIKGAHDIGQMIGRALSPKSKVQESALEAVQGAKGVVLPSSAFVSPTTVKRNVSQIGF